MINIKYCKKCKRAFDIGTNNDVCPRCRIKKKREKKDVEKKRI